MQDCSLLRTGRHSKPTRPVGGLPEWFVNFLVNLKYIEVIVAFQLKAVAAFLHEVAYAAAIYEALRTVTSSGCSLSKEGSTVSIGRLPALHV